MRDAWESGSCGGVHGRWRGGAQNYIAHSSSARGTGSCCCLQTYVGLIAGFVVEGVRRLKRVGPGLAVGSTGGVCRRGAEEGEGEGEGERARASHGRASLWRTLK